MLKDKLLLEGILPERALLRLKREGIGIYQAKKIRKNAVLFSVNAKDTEKVFAIYPKICYNKENHSPYRITRVGANRAKRLVDFFKFRWGILVGSALFCIALPFAERYVLKIEIEGSAVYGREVMLALKKRGITRFSKYDGTDGDLVCSELLSLDGVEYCALKKRGGTLVVEIRESAFAKPKTQTGEMRSTRAGTVLSLTVLRGTPLVKQGDTVAVGEPIVGNYILSGEGTEWEEREEVAPIARAEFSCVYENYFTVATAEEAFANAYLELGLSDDGKIRERSVEQEGEEFFVRLAYTEIQTVNF